MTLNELTKIFSGDGRGAAIKRLATGLKPGKVAAINGAVGSALALTLATLPHRDAPYIIVADDADSAGYLYNDLEALTASGQTLIFPSGYKRDIRYGQTDAASDILRTEVINQVQSAVGGAAPAHPVRGGLLIVTYPEALAEKVADRRTASEGTVSLAVGDNADPVAVVERLVGLGFQRVDYVYEPGQVAMRGSIVDVYSFTNEWPFRLDFFGDEVDSIRTFDVETQLSKERLECVAVMGNQGGDTAAGVSLLEFAGIDSAVLVTRDLNDLVARVRAVGNAKMSDSALIAGEADKDAMRRVVDPDRFEADARAMARIEVRSTKYEVRTEERGEVQSGGKENTETQKLRPSSFTLLRKASITRTLTSSRRRLPTFSPAATVCSSAATTPSNSNACEPSLPTVTTASPLSRLTARCMRVLWTMTSRCASSPTTRFLTASTSTPCAANVPAAANSPCRCANCSKSRWATISSTRTTASAALAACCAPR